MKRAELVFVPAPLAGHLFSMAEAAKLLLNRDDRLSITVLIMPNHFDANYNKQKASLVASSESTRLQFVELPNHDQELKSDDTSPHPLISLIQNQKPHVKDAVSKLVTRSESNPNDSPRLAGFVFDMSCTGMLDVAHDFAVPCYGYSTSGAAFLSLRLYIQDLFEEQKVDPTEFYNSGIELAVPGLAAPLPASVLPGPMLKMDWFRAHYRKGWLREIKGIMVNTFVELESYAVNSFSDGNVPPLYPVGPILNLDHRADENSEYKDIMGWLDDQRPSSVVFLCFGSMGSFGADQVKEIARALERSGHPFLWSLRKPPPEGKMESPSKYLNPQEALPDGFLDRTAGIGKVIGWAPQVAVLAHPAIGGFVSHCGWNSILESLWFGVPIATWPIYAEQQFNAFLLLKELGLATEIKMDYRRDIIFAPEIQDFVGAKQIERGIRRVMEQDSEIRKKVKKMSAWSREALMDGGSSHCSLTRLIQDLMGNVLRSKIFSLGMMWGLQIFCSD